MVEQRQLLEQLKAFRRPELVELVLPGQSFADYSYLLDRQNGTVHSFTSPFNTCEVKPLRIAGKLETTKTQLSPPDQVFANVSDNPYQPKNFKDSNR